jgi:NAD(P)-dependent dehydrogenase (short-subunit alcohol dehydrogenase family)
VLGDVDAAGLERTVAELGAQVRGKRTDVSRRDDVAALFKFCDEAFGPVEILVTCAGIISSTPLSGMTEEESNNRRPVRMCITANGIANGFVPAGRAGTPVAAPADRR